jgi:hypothetical protein
MRSGAEAGNLSASSIQLSAFSKQLSAVSLRWEAISETAALSQRAFELVQMLTALLRG